MKKTYTARSEACPEEEAEEGTLAMAVLLGALLSVCIYLILIHL